MTKHSFLYISVFLLLLLFCECKDSKTAKISHLQSTIDSIKSKYVPDRRVNVFDIEISGIINDKPVIKGYTSSDSAYQELTRLIDKENLTDSIKMLPDNTLGDSIFGIINLSVADIRTKPDFSSEMATQAILGTPVNILQKDDWYRIQTPDGYIGWTHKANFQAMTESDFKIWKSSKKIVFTDYFGFSYLQPDRNSQPVSDLVNCNFLKLESESGDFYKVSYPDGAKRHL